MEKAFAGSAREFTFTCCGYTINTGWVALFNGSESLVASATFSNSGAGYYWAVITLPSSKWIYAAEFNAYYGTDYLGNPALYKKKMFLEIILGEAV